MIRNEPLQCSVLICICAKVEVISTGIVAVHSVIMPTYALWGDSSPRLTYVYVTSHRYVQSLFWVGAKVARQTWVLCRLSSIHELHSEGFGSTIWVGDWHYNVVVLMTLFYDREIDLCQHFARARGFRMLLSRYDVSFYSATHCWGMIYVCFMMGFSCFLYKQLIIKKHKVKVYGFVFVWWNWEINATCQLLKLLMAFLNKSWFIC